MLQRHLPKFSQLVNHEVSFTQTYNLQGSARNHLTLSFFFFSFKKKKRKRIWDLWISLCTKFGTPFNLSFFSNSASCLYSGLHCVFIFLLLSPNWYRRFRIQLTVLAIIPYENVSTLPFLFFFFLASILILLALMTSITNFCGRCVENVWCLEKD